MGTGTTRSMIEVTVSVERRSFRSPRRVSSLRSTSGRTMKRRVSTHRWPRRRTCWIGPRVDLSSDGSQPTIKAASDGGYVVAWEVGVTDDIHVRLNYYPTWDALLTGVASKVSDAERQLPGCGEGTPNLYSASSTRVDFGPHFFRDCRTDTQARGTTDWVTWDAVEEPLLDRAAYLQGYRGSVGDRDMIEYRGYEFTFLEAQFTQNDWSTFRVLVYDAGTGEADRLSYPDFASQPPSVHVNIHTHRGSYSFFNMTIAQVDFHGGQVVVVTVTNSSSTASMPTLCATRPNTEA